MASESKFSSATPIAPHIALYPGTFDGVTYGHLDIIRRGANLFDQLYVAVARKREQAPAVYG